MLNSSLSLYSNYKRYSGGSTPPTGPKTFSGLFTSIVGATPASGSSTVTINNVGNLYVNATLTRSSGIAPLAISINASASLAYATVAPIPFSDLDYVIDFGDENGSKWQYGTYPGVYSKNVAYGPISAHVYETPGTYYPVLTVYGFTSAGVQFTKVVNLGPVVVADPATLPTVYVGKTLPVAGQGGVPVGANVYQMTNWSDLSTLSNTYQNILLNGGDIWDIDASANISHAGPGRIARYGAASPTGTNLILDYTAFVIPSNDWRIVDITVSGTTGDQVQTKAGIVAGDSSGNVTYSNLLALRCNFNYVGIGISSLNMVGLYIVDSDIGNTYYNNFGIACYLVNTDYLSVLGSYIHDVTHDHGFRAQGCRYSVFSNSTFIRSDGTSLTIRGNTTGTQATPWNGLWTEKIVVSDCSFGPTTSTTGYAFYCGPQSVGHAERCRDLIFERNICTNGPLYAADFSVASGMCVRNNIFTTQYTYAVNISMPGNSAGSPAMNGGQFYNNTMYKIDTSLSTYFSGFFVFNVTGGTASNTLGTGLILDNLLCYAPGNTQDGSQSGSSPTIAVFYGGTQGQTYTLTNYSSPSQVLNNKPWAATTPTAIADFTPVSGSYAIGSGIFHPIMRDIKRGTITAPYNLGAINT